MISKQAEGPASAPPTPPETSKQNAASSQANLQQSANQFLAQTKVMLDRLEGNSAELQEVLERHSETIGRGTAGGENLHQQLSMGLDKMASATLSAHGMAMDFSMS